MKERYQHYMGQQMVEATGLKKDLAESIQQRNPKLVNEFRDVLDQLSQHSDPRGESTVSIDKTAAPDYASVDIFHMLGNLPEHYFADPTADHTAKIKELLSANRDSTRFADGLRRQAHRPFRQALRAGDARGSRDAGLL